MDKQLWNVFRETGDPMGYLLYKAERNENEGRAGKAGRAGKDGRDKSGAAGGGERAPAGDALL